MQISVLKSMSERVLDAEAIMREMPQAQLRTNHYYADGIYARELHQPQGCVLIGKVHKREHLYVVTKGRVRVVMDEVARDYEAPAVIVSKPGTKRAIYALEDSIYMTIHRTKKRNLDKIERELIEEDRLARFDARNNVMPLLAQREGAV